MSWGRWGGNWAGRFSPFTRSPVAGSGELSDGAFSYITSEDLKRNNIERSHGDDDDDDDDPRAHSSHHHHHDDHHHHRRSQGSDTDTLVLRSKDEQHLVRFQAQSIDRGLLRVGDIRSAAAKYFDTSPKNMRIYYKGRNLNNDARLARDEGLISGKPSELLCVRGDEEDDEDEDDLEDEDDSAAPGEPAAKKKKRRGKKKKPRRSDADPGTAYSSNSASGGAPSASATFIPPSAIPTPASRSAASTPAPPNIATPQTAVEKIRALTTHFNTTLLPLCRSYVESPPADKAKRDFEHKKLTETIMGQVLLKLDAVEPEGDPEARTKRKEAVKEVNAWLSKLDSVVGK